MIFGAEFSSKRARCSGSDTCGTRVIIRLYDNSKMYFRVTGRHTDRIGKSYHSSSDSTGMSSTEKPPKGHLPQSRDCDQES